MNIVYWLLGYVDIYVKSKDAVTLLNLCMYYSIPYSRFSYDDCGISVRLRLSHYKKIQIECNSRNIELSEKCRGGIPVFIYNNRKRSGFVIGGVLAILMMVIFDSFIWDINISGNTTVTSSEIIEELSSYGVRVGANKNKIHTQSIENRILIESEDISFISINIQGNIANVEIREREKENPKEPKRYANITARKSGVIERAQIYRGNLVVSAGQYVDAGDLLISGIYDSKIQGFRFTRASGSVYARTVEEILIEIPLEYEEKRYTGKVNYEKSLNFFGFSVKISKNYGNDMVLYDTISSVEDYNLWDGVRLPLDSNKITLHEYEYIKCTRSIDEARELGYFKLSEKIQELEKAEILKKSVDTYTLEDKLILVCTLVCIEDISSVTEFDVDLSIREN